MHANLALIIIFVQIGIELNRPKVSPLMIVTLKNLNLSFFLLGSATLAYICMTCKLEPHFSLSLA
jgi:hypothetical protein